MTNIISLPARSSIYQCKITLQGSKPVIWRRFQVSEEYSLRKFHKVLQIVMGWDECHLYEFQIDGTSYGEPHPDYGGSMKNSKTIKLNQLIEGEKASFQYIYDFGDGWQHKIVVEKIFKPEPDVRYPACIGGAMACPPEDCGGIGGYADFLEAISDPDHDEHETMLHWIGGKFDPEAFDCDRVNAKLKRMK